MYGDTSVIRTLAGALRDQASDLRAQADALLAQAESVPWSGWAADAMRAMARERVAALHRSAGAHEDAAQALEHHAAEVDRLKDLIAEIERRVGHLVQAARHRLADLAGGLLDGLRAVLPDPVDELLARFVPPPPGHRDWLHVELPGLGR